MTNRHPIDYVLDPRPDVTDDMIAQAFATEQSRPSKRWLVIAGVLAVIVFVAGIAWLA